MKDEKKNKQGPKTDKGQAIANLETQAAMAEEPYKSLIKKVIERLKKKAI